METSPLLRVLVGSSHLPADESQPTLIIEAEPERFEALQQQLEALPSAQSTVLHQAVLAATSQAELLWFRFNDSRLNGIVPVERWHDVYPNLQLQKAEIVRSQTLANILDQWPAALPSDQGISVTISQGDPIEVLKGADAWGSRIHRIQLQAPKAEVLWLEACESWLERQGFKRESASALSWVVDAEARQRINQETELESLRRQVSTIIPQHQRDLEESNRHLSETHKALSLTFPYAAYRKKCPELNLLSDHDLLSHYMSHGMREGIDLQFSALQEEWQQHSEERPENGSFVSVPGAEEDSSQKFGALTVPEPTIPSLSDIQETEICCWLVWPHLYVSFPDELANTISPAIYKGGQGFALNKTEWTDEILKELLSNQVIHLFSQRNRQYLKALSHDLNPPLLDIGINQIPSFSVHGGQTLHVHLLEAQNTFELSLLEDLEIQCLWSETWTFEALIAVHRAKGNLEIIISHNGKSKLSSVKFDSEKIGGMAPTHYLPIKVILPLEKGASKLSLKLKHIEFTGEPESSHDSYYFVANPILRACGSLVDGSEHKLQPRLLKPEQKISKKAVLFKSFVSPFASSFDSHLVLSLGNGKCYEVFAPLQAVVTIREDHSHTLILDANPAGDYALFINSKFSTLITISGDATPVQLPVHWLRGEPVQVEIRDPSGGQIFVSHPVLAPRFLTPVELLLQESKPPFPTDLTVRANHRYQALRQHLLQPIDGIKPEMLMRALQTLDLNYNTVQLAPLEFPVIAEPAVSVVIPAHNKVEVTFYALCALLLAHNSVSFEIILVDDGSTDETAEMEKWVSGIRVIHNEQPLRFIKACNIGVSEAKGTYVVLLNNDTEVTVGWLDALVDGFRRFEHVGAVGAKLLYPDGRLQDAGGIIWASGNPWNYGNGMNPWEPRFCYARQVDYLSGAALMTTKAIWDQVGGLSHYLEPMYFEDTDFSFKVREAGYKTYFIPSSVVYHFEGTTSGTDINKSHKKYQEINRPKFKHSWAKAFARHGEEGVKPDLEKDRGIAGRILFLDYGTPREDRDAGSYAANREIELVQSLGYKVTFLPQVFDYLGAYTDELTRNGVEVIASPFYRSAASFLAERAQEFDAVYITRYNVAADTVHLIREHSPKTRILLNIADLHFLRELRAALIENNQARMDIMRTIRQQELETMRSVDLVLSYNETEHTVITTHTDGQVKVMTCPWVVRVPAEITPLSERKGLSFLGSFHHHPNVEGLQWFCRNVMPMIEEQHLKLTVYGSGMDVDISDVTSDWIEQVGYIKDVALAYQQHRVFIAPLLSGAGVKGKVVGALAYGIPTVLTPIAAEGIGLRHGYDCMIARNAEEWLAAITELYKNDELWQSISTTGRNYAASHFSFEAGKEKMKAALEAVDLYSHLNC